MSSSSSQRSAADPSVDAPTRAEISLGAVAHNLTAIRRLAGRADVMAVVKADAYGHGARKVALHLEANGVSDFAVATIPEAIALREAGVKSAILVFAPPLDRQIEVMDRERLDINVTSLDRARRVSESGFSGRVHLKVDSGMSRMGVALNELEEALDCLSGAAALRLHAIWTHFATADEPGTDFVAVQADRFYRAITPVRDAAPYVHLANSGAILNHAATLDFDEHTIVRPGISLYGLSPSPDVDLASRHGLIPAMRLVSRVSHMHEVEAGTPVSYSRRWYAPRRTHVATIQAGYADGYPRMMTNKGRVRIDGGHYPIAGTVCMDAFMVDAGTTPTISFGDEAVLFGPEGPSCFEVAQRSGTITYEITCRVSARVPRQYRKDVWREGSHSSP